MPNFRSVLRAVPAALAVLSAAQLFAGTPKWELVWSDEFNGSGINNKYWTKIERGAPDWKKHMSPDPSLYAVKKGCLILRGKVNPNTKKDPVPFITGGITTKGKFSFRKGKIEIRAKLDCAQGAWPALWLMPEKPEGVWPACGEIDIMEHLNFDDIVYQTIHSRFADTLGRRNPPPGGTAKINKKDFNVYGLEWHEDKLVFLVNDKATFTYPRVPAAEGDGQWPFTTPFYILIDMQLGGKWVGAVNAAQLPVEMTVDWVRVYRDVSAPAKKKKK